MTVNDKIVSTALNFNGILEIGNNEGFSDETFQSYMEDVGWDKGQAWCSYATELIWKLAYVHQQNIVKILDSTFSGSAVQSYKSFKKGNIFTVSKEPVEGALVYWQTYRDGKPHWTGHAGIVIDFDGEDFETIEGNTNKEGSRDGNGIWERVRGYDFEVNNGLRLLGFVHPIEKI